MQVGYNINFDFMNEHQNGAEIPDESLDTLLPAAIARIYQMIKDGFREGIFLLEDGQFNDLYRCSWTFSRR